MRPAEWQTGRDFYMEVIADLEQLQQLNLAVVYVLVEVVL